MYKASHLPSAIVDTKVEAAARGVSLGLWRCVPLLPVPPEPRPGEPGLGEVGLRRGGRAPEGQVPGVVWRGGVDVPLLPGQQVQQGDGDGVAGNHWIPGKRAHSGVGLVLVAYTADGFLKARGCMLLMSSPLSQVILARLAFLTSPSCSSVRGDGLEDES